MFKIFTDKGNYFIAQCLFDYGYINGGRTTQNFEHRYEYKVIAFAQVSIDFGDTHLRPETKMDKFTNLLFKQDISFENAEKFNDKYYLISTKKDQVEKYFSIKFLAEIASNNNLLLSIHNCKMFVSFTSDLASHQLFKIQKLLKSFDYLANREIM